MECTTATELLQSEAFTVKGVELTHRGGLKAAKVIASVETMRVVMLEDGRYACFWGGDGLGKEYEHVEGTGKNQYKRTMRKAGHAEVFADKEALLASESLNSHERQVLTIKLGD